MTFSTVGHRGRHFENVDPDARCDGEDRKQCRQRDAALRTASMFGNRSGSRRQARSRHGRCTLSYRREGRKLAVAVVHRDLEGLRAEVEFERIIAAER